MKAQLYRRLQKTETINSSGVDRGAREAPPLTEGRLQLLAVGGEGAFFLCGVAAKSLSVHSDRANGTQQVKNNRKRGHETGRGVC